jgi:plastocyanin
VDGKPGKILGASALLSAGVHAEVAVNVAVAAGKSYFAMTHSDNGDGKYVPADDEPIKGPGDAIIVVKFSIAGEAMMEKEEKAAAPGANVNAGVNVNVGVQVTTPKTVAVTIKDFAFGTATVTVKKGDRVVWTQMDSAPHTVTADNKAFASALLSSGQSFTLDTSTLAAGTYPYHCEPHPFMTATLVVQ